MTFELEKGSEPSQVASESDSEAPQHHGVGVLVRYVEIPYSPCMNVGRELHAKTVTVAGRYGACPAYDAACTGLYVDKDDPSTVHRVRCIVHVMDIS